MAETGAPKEADEVGVSVLRASLSSSSSTADAQQSEVALRILEAAMTLFAHKGYAATSVREIVQAAQVTNPVLYYYYESKEGVFYKLIDILFGEMDTRVREVFEGQAHLSFREQLREVIKVHITLATSSPIAVQFVYAVLFGPRDSRPDFDPLACRVHTMMTVYQAFERAIERGEFRPHSGFDTAFLLAQFFGMLNQHLLTLLVEQTHPPTSPEEQLFMQSLHSEGHIERLLNFYLQGAGTILEPGEDGS